MIRIRVIRVEKMTDLWKTKKIHNQMHVFDDDDSHKQLDSTGTAPHSRNPNRSFLRSPSRTGSRRDSAQPGTVPLESEQQCLQKVQARTHPPKEERAHPPPPHESEQKPNGSEIKQPSHLPAARCRVSRRADPWPSLPPPPGCFPAAEQEPLAGEEGSGRSQEKNPRPKENSAASSSRAGWVLPSGFLADTHHAAPVTV